MEILAPAGSISALKAAIRAGADAVYLGLGEHNARIKSNDFTTENLSEWVGYAHLFGVKVYVTLNTAVKNEERCRALELAVVAAESGADALIVADLGLASLIASKVDIPLHLSTQAGVQNSFDVLALEGLKIKRVILSRETPVSEISEIKRYVDEVEIFVQGAICVSFSGGCLLGSKMYGASGNRGLCNQACRLTYTAVDGSGTELMKGKLLSPKDLSLGEKVRDLAALGVDSIKIEGRLKRAQYVYAATKYYRDLLAGKDTSDDFKDLCESFNRGFTKGYSLIKSANIINPLTSSHIGVEVGKVKKTLLKNGYKYALVESSHRFVKGDGAKILRKGVEVGGSDVTSVKTVGSLQEIPVSDGVSVGDSVCLTTNAKKDDFAESITNALPITMTLNGGVGQRVTLSLNSGEYSVSVTSQSEAQSSVASDNAPILEKLSKVGGTDFCIDRIVDKVGTPIFLALSEINRMRREGLSLLREKIVQDRKPRYHVKEDIHYSAPCSKGKALTVFEVETLDSRVGYLTADAFVLSPPVMDCAALTNALTAAGDKPVYLRLPKILRQSELPALMRLLEMVPNIGIYADNLYAVQIARDLKRRYIAGFGLNVFNDDTAKLFSDADLVAGAIEYPYAGDLCFVAGKIRLMSFAHCPFSVVYKTNCATCDKSRDRLLYRSGEFEYLILRRLAVGCDFTMLENNVTYYKELTNKSTFFSFVGLDEKEKRAVMDYCGGNR